MTELFAFRAIRYDARRVALDSVLTQPYDKISAEMQERYAAASPYNLISIEKGKSFASDSAENNVYTRASRKLEEWLADGVLIQDAEPAIYAYFQNYEIPGTTQRLERRGFIALGRLADYEERVVFRHEHTLTAPKADRLELLRHTRAQTGQLFMLYDDPARRVDGVLEETAKQAPVAEMRDEYHVRHRLWAISDPATIQRITSAMADKKLVIADGHHRYETALAYRNECRAKDGRIDPDAPYEKAMWTCFNTRQEGLTILPTHRVVRNLPRFSIEKFLEAASQYFNWYAYPFASAAEYSQSFAEFHHDFKRRGHAGHTIGVYTGNQAFYLLVLRNSAELERLLPDISPAQRQLDVVLLHRLLLHKCLGITAEKVTAETNVTYEREMEAAIGAVDRGAAQIAFLLNPVRVAQVVEIALAGDVMPQKSTDFYPKLLSGLCIYRM
ncbi:MAG TPA: DUF1015 domain-containing protein [Candidatus Acidoferrales bacterium]|nr:DUF1015 domain-containing protein [Candidatus Acidoferrales bacterium]